MAVLHISCRPPPELSASHRRRRATTLNTRPARNSTPTRPRHCRRRTLSSGLCCTTGWSAWAEGPAGQGLTYQTTSSPPTQDNPWRSSDKSLERQSPQYSYIATILKQSPLPTTPYGSSYTPALFILSILSSHTNQCLYTRVLRLKYFIEKHRVVLSDVSSSFIDLNHMLYILLGNSVPVSLDGAQQRRRRRR